MALDGVRAQVEVARDQLVAVTGGDALQHLQLPCAQRLGRTLGLRLAPDMLPFAKQIQIACDSAKGAMARLSGTEIPKHPDTETTLAELTARVALVIDYVQSFKPEQLDGTEGKEIVLKLGPKQDRILNFTGQSFLQGFAMGNFYFHISMAYALLRHQGVELGKQDFLGRE